MENKKLQRKTLAQFITDVRENAGMSRTGLAKSANLDIEIIDRIETGQDLFLSTVERHRLARALKLEHTVIKLHEKEPVIPGEVPKGAIDTLRVKILAGELEGNACPSCKSELICRIALMHDLEDKPVYHAKARCSKCPFMLR
ncbi:MAG: hypothetical protein WCK67_06220 [bacterium]